MALHNKICVACVFLVCLGISGLEAKAAHNCCVVNFDQDATGDGTVGVTIAPAAMGSPFQATFALNDTDDKVRDDIMALINAVGTGLVATAIGDTTFIVQTTNGTDITDCTPENNDTTTVVGAGIFSDLFNVVADFDLKDAITDVETVAETMGDAAADLVNATIDANSQDHDPLVTETDMDVRDALSTAHSATNVGRTAFVKPATSITCTSDDANIFVSCTDFNKIPTVSEWGLAAMVLLVLVTGTIVFRRFGANQLAT